MVGGSCPSQTRNGQLYNVLYGSNLSNYKQDQSVGREIGMWAPLLYFTCLLTLQENLLYNCNLTIY